MGKLKNSHDHVTKIIVTIFILNSRRPTVQMRPNLYYVDHNTKITTWVRPGQDRMTLKDKNDMSHGNIPLPGRFTF